MRTTFLAIPLVCAAWSLGPSAGSAQTTFNGTAGADDICAVYDLVTARNVICFVGGVPSTAVLPLTINGLGGDDNITIYDDTFMSSCGCICMGVIPDAFRYGGSSVTVNGGDGNDDVAGGDGTNFLNGDDGNDRLYGHRGADTIYGGKGADTILDCPMSFASGGATDVLDGEGGDDCMGDTSSFTSCIGGPDVDAQITLSTCTVENPGGNCVFACP